MLWMHHFSRVAQERARAANADGLRCALNLATIRSPGESRREWSRPAKLHVERNLFCLNSSGQRREAMHILKGSGQLCSVLLNVHCAIFRAQPASP